MQSNNPVFRRSEEFNRPGATAYAGSTGYTDPSTWGTGTPGAPSVPTTAQQPMTIDSVVHHTGKSRRRCLTASSRSGRFSAARAARTLGPKPAQV